MCHLGVPVGRVHRSVASCILPVLGTSASLIGFGARGPIAHRPRPFFMLSLLPACVAGLLRSSPSWSFQKFASGRMATLGATSLNVTFAGA